MLILAGVEGDEFDIDNGRIIVQIAWVKGGQVRLAFDAPPDVPIDRAKIAMRKAENPQ